MFTELCCSVTSVLFVLMVYMEVVLEPNTVSDRIKDPQLKQIKRCTSSNI